MSAKTGLIGLLVVALLGGMGGGFWWYTNSKNEQNQAAWAETVSTCQTHFEQTETERQETISELERVIALADGVVDSSQAQTILDSLNNLSAPAYTPGEEISKETAVAAEETYTQYDELLANAAETIPVLEEEAEAAVSLTAEQLNSLEVPAICQQEAGTLVDGALDIDPYDGMVQINQETSAIGQIVPGKGDGAAVVFDCNGGGIGWPQQVLFYDNHAEVVGQFDTSAVGESPGRQTVTAVEFKDGQVVLTVAAVPLPDDNVLWGSSEATAVYEWDVEQEAMVQTSLEILDPAPVAEAFAQALQDRDRDAALELGTASVVNDLWPTGNQNVTVGEFSYDDTWATQFLELSQRGYLIYYEYPDAVPGEGGITAFLIMMEVVDGEWQVVDSRGIAG